jgi:hypothetical protein
MYIYCNICIYMYIYIIYIYNIGGCVAPWPGPPGRRAPRQLRTVMALHRPSVGYPCLWPMGPLPAPLRVTHWPALPWCVCSVPHHTHHPARHPGQGAHVILTTPVHPPHSHPLHTPLSSACGECLRRPLP